METLKQTIKDTVERQINFKRHRKTVKFEGERIWDATDAYLLHKGNRDALRHMYAAYAILRGKDPYIADPAGKGVLSQGRIDNLLLAYTDKVK